MKGPLISVVVPTRNSQKTLEKCLRSVKNQTYPHIEIIVVDNFSSDGTLDIARKYGRVFLKRSERSASRNYGAKRASGQYIFFVDSDMYLTPTVIEECVQKAREGYDAIVIPEISLGEGFWARCKELERLCYIGDNLIESVAFFNRESFEAVGGYDEDLTAFEDFDIHQRVKKAGYRIGRVSSYIVHIESRLTLRKLIAKKYYYGKWVLKYIKKNREIAVLQLSPFRCAYLKHLNVICGSPLTFLGIIVMKVTEYMAGLIGLLSSIAFTSSNLEAN